MTDTIRIGSRGSQLALWQANHIADALRAAGHAVEIEIIHTTGDRLQSDANTDGQPSLAPLADGKGIFIKEIEEALAEGRIDLAVHSLKDLPTALDPRFTLAAIPLRADPRDAYVCPRQKALHTLPTGALVGTTSPRRRAQLLALRPDLRFVELRGNIDTRLRKLAEGECNALVLAAAGLDRLGRTEWLRQRFTIEEICPAPGQGALALEVRASATRAASFTDCAEQTSADPARDGRIRQAVATLDHPETRFSVEAERTVLDALGGGCQLPIGVHCAPVYDVADPIPNTGAPIAWRIQAQVVAPDGERMICLSIEVPAGVTARILGLRAPEDLKSRGALELLEQSTRPLVSEDEATSSTRL
jgi:hydroxymethylbilane synthase